MKHFQTHIVILVLFLLAGIISSAGCNKARIPGLVRCEGIVTWKGAPVEGARVAFIPKNQPDGRGAFGITDSGGRFKATTLDLHFPRINQTIIDKIDLYKRPALGV